MPDPECGNSNYYLSLSKWLEGFGIGNILIFFGFLIFALLLDKAKTGYLVWALLVSLFSFSWMIIGSVV
jgi:hypothetical protein